MDVTWNLMPLILWVKIENYTIPLAATATVLRLFIKVFVNKECGSRRNYGYTTSSYGRSAETAVELTSQARSQYVIEPSGNIEVTASRSLHGSETELVDHDGIQVKYEYEVRVESKGVREPNR